jgi:hypothetical protein
MYEMEEFKCFQLVELPVLNTGTNFKVAFPSQPQLQSTLGQQLVYIRGVEVFSNSALSANPITTTNPVAAPGDITNATLTIVEQGTENKQFIPLARLNRTFAQGASIVPYPPPLFRFKELYTVDFTKCFVTIVAPPAAVPFSYLFGFYYDYGM